MTDAGVANLELYDATVIVAATGKPAPYRLVNVVCIAPALDRERSTFNADEDGFIMELLSIALDDARCAGRPFFRLQERPNLLVISAEVGAAVEAAGITGVSVVAPEAWSPGMS